MANVFLNARVYDNGFLFQIDFREIFICDSYS